MFFIGYYIGKIFYLKDLGNKSIKEKKQLYKQLINFISYSEFYEDLILFTFLFDAKKGFYIDLGAGDPNIISVTKSFYLRGWHGINIEPYPNAYINLNKTRSRDINLQIGIGEKEGIQPFYLEGLTLKKIYSKDKKVLNISIHTMKDICNKYMPKNEKIQFCKIDIEGGEKSALLGFDFENHRPKVFCIESTKPNTYIPNYEEWEEILMRNDFSFAYQYKINRFYFDNRIKGLRERFFLIEYAINIYKKNLIYK